MLVNKLFQLTFVLMISWYDKFRIWKEVHYDNIADIAVKPLKNLNPVMHCINLKKQVVKGLIMKPSVVHTQ